ncbi:hypothetical protein M0R45_018537 [Rubus argutus]|uniref:F-box domain-containing protein n=1 Tax=Rubus argutus TaxID=59490 RepID=A0AAW1X307_RUBAR
MDVECRLHQKSWSKLQSELLGFITTKLGSVDVIRFRAVCNCWKRAATSYISSPGHKLMPQTLMLMIPSGEKKDAHTRRFFNLAENKTFTLKNVFRDFRRPGVWVHHMDGWCLWMRQENWISLIRFLEIGLNSHQFGLLLTLSDGKLTPNFSDVFSSNKNSVTNFSISGQFYDPLPFWIVPNPWSSSVIYGAPSSSSLSGPQA